MFSVQPLPDALAQTTSQPRLNMLLLSLFAAAALLLAAIGLYGVLSQAVAGRRREIGLRLALGARPADILASVSAQSAAVAAAGIAAGLGGALALTRLLSSLVFEVSARDPLAFAAAPVARASVAAAATLGPARRAAGTDPMVALRDE